MNNKKLGNWGEALAKRQLLKMGYQIIAQNLHLGRLELDLIAKKNNLITFFEIKTRLASDKSLKDNFLSQKQILNLKKAASIYAAINCLSFEQLSFGLITITLTDNLEKQKTGYINFYLNIF